VEIESRTVTDERGAYDDGQLPWLQAVEDEDEPRGVSARKMLAALLVVLLAGAMVAGTFFWLGQRGAEITGPPELIEAEPGPYKVKPADPGGLDVAGESETAFQTSAGEDTDSQLDLNAVPERPIAVPKPEPKAEAPAKAAGPERTAPTGGSGSVIQLGFFDNQTQAERAWSALAARFPNVAAMNKIIVPYSGGIRLRAGAASPADARQACRTLQAAGENCFVAR
jgi:hypothetical protein